MMTSPLSSKISSENLQSNDSEDSTRNRANRSIRQRPLDTRRTSETDFHKKKTGKASSCCPVLNVNPYDNTISCQTGVSQLRQTDIHLKFDVDASFGGSVKRVFPISPRARATSPNDLGSSPAIRSHATITRRFIRCSICKRVVEAVAPRPETWH